MRNKKTNQPLETYADIPEKWRNRIELLEAQINNLHSYVESVEKRHSYTKKKLEAEIAKHREFENVVVSDAGKILTNMSVLADVLWPPDPRKSKSEIDSRDLTAEKSILTYMILVVGTMMEWIIAQDPHFASSDPRVQRAIDFYKEKNLTL